MGRFLFLILLVVAIVWLAKRAFRSPGKDGDAERKPPIEGDLVSCARCGVHLPRVEAREAQGALFCSEEHARLGRGGGAA
jgi:uncharacterized protein